MGKKYPIFPAVGALKILFVSEASQVPAEEPQDTVPATAEEIAASIHGTPGSKPSSEVQSGHGNGASTKTSSPSSPESSLPPSASQAGDDVPSQNT